MRRLAFGLLLAASVAAAGRAQASPDNTLPRAPARVLLLRTGCERSAFDEEALARMLRVELAGRSTVEFELDRAEEIPPAGSVAIALLKACSGEDLIVVVVASGDGVTATRPLPLGGVARTLRERTAALAIAEILRAGPDPEVRSLGEPTERDTRPPDPTDFATMPEPSGSPRDRVSIEITKPPPEGRLPVFVSAGVEWRFLFDHEAALTGARLAASIPLRLRSRWIARFSGEGAAVYDGDKDREGEAGLWLLSGSLGASAGYSWGGAEITAGPRIELGFCGARYRPREPDAQTTSASGPVAIASAVASGRVELAARIWVSLDVELGHSLRGFISPIGGRAPVGIEGPIGSGRAALAFAF